MLLPAGPTPALAPLSVSTPGIVFLPAVPPMPMPLALALVPEFTAVAVLSSTGTSLSFTPEEQAAKAAVKASIEKVRINIFHSKKKKSVQ
jgi:hypothetical protein